MAEPFIGQISAFACNFAPRMWAFCRGQLMAIQQNPALFSIIGTTYGGNGTTNFALPDLQGQAPMHWGTTGGLPPTVLGEVQGVSSVTLLVSNLPQHTHAAIAAAGTSATHTAIPDANSYLSNSTQGDSLWDSTAPVINAPFYPLAIGMTGGSQAHDNMQPYLTLNYCIAVEGVFPSRN